MNRNKVIDTISSYNVDFFIFNDYIFFLGMTEELAEWLANLNTDETGMVVLNKIVYNGEDPASIVTALGPLYV
jgi:hypothetical protein